MFVFLNVVIALLIIISILTWCCYSVMLCNRFEFVMPILCHNYFFVLLFFIVQPDLPSRSQKEGRETDQFWEILGGKSKYTNQKLGREHESDPHLFACIISKGNTISGDLRIYRVEFTIQHLLTLSFFGY